MADESKLYDAHEFLESARLRPDVSGRWAIDIQQCLSAILAHLRTPAEPEKCGTCGGLGLVRRYCDTCHGTGTTTATPEKERTDERLRPEHTALDTGSRNSGRDAGSVEVGGAGDVGVPTPDVAVTTATPGGGSSGAAEGNDAGPEPSGNGLRDPDQPPSGEPPEPLPEMLPAGTRWKNTPDGGGWYTMPNPATYDAWSGIYRWEQDEPGEKTWAVPPILVDWASWRASQPKPSSPAPDAPTADGAVSDEDAGPIAVPLVAQVTDEDMAREMYECAFPVREGKSWDELSDDTRRWYWEAFRFARDLGREQGRRERDEFKAMWRHRLKVCGQHKERIAELEAKLREAEALQARLRAMARRLIGSGIVRDRDYTLGARLLAALPADERPEVT